MPGLVILAEVQGFQNVLLKAFFLPNDFLLVRGIASETG